jgi:MFS family permease
VIKNFISFLKLKPAFAVGFLFAVSSIVFGIWVAAIPSIKQRLGFTDGTLGLSLLLSPLGALTGVGLSTILFKKISVGKWMYFGYSLLCLIMVVEINSPNRLLLWVCLYLFGLVSFLNGVSSNATVSSLEHKYNRLFMSTCHGLYSLGGAVSAGVAVLFFAMGLKSSVQIVIVAVVLLFILFKNRHYLLMHTEIIHSGSGLKMPSLTILGISFICLVVFMAEGCVADWSALYLKESMHAPKEVISLGYASFAVAMTFGRFNGDTLISKIGSKKIVIAGSLLAAFGFTLVVTAPVIVVALLGYTCIGLGCSCIVPVLFSASATIPGVSKVEGFAMVTTGGLIGFLTGPSLIGFISEKSNLSAGLSLLILATISAAIVAWRNKFLLNKKHPQRELAFDEQLY